MEEKYIISKAKETQDPYAAKSWIIAAKTLFPNDFSVQSMSYEIEKKSNHYEEAAKCFSYIVMTFQHQPNNLWTEISNITQALRVSEGNGTPEQDFYVKMFQYIPYEVQHKILLLTANHSNNNLDLCRLILLLLKRFPLAIQTHAPRLLETLIQNIAVPQFKEMLVLEAIPLVYSKPPTDISNTIAHRIMAICFEYHINQMFTVSDEDKTKTVTEGWRKIFDILDFCGKILKWEPFLTYKKGMSKDFYWQKIIQIVSSAPTRPSENKQILFIATIIFVLCLQDYINSMQYKAKDGDIDVILVDGLKELSLENPLKRRKLDEVSEVSVILVNPPCNPDIPQCFTTASNCWRLLHSNEILQSDFQQLCRNIPISSWIKRFILDLSIYNGHHEETNSLIKTSSSRKMGLLEKNLRNLSLNLAQGTFSVQSFEFISAILSNLPNIQGTYLHTIVGSSNTRNLVLLPLSRRAILHYLVQILMYGLRPKLMDPTSNNILMGNLLVLSQLNWNQESFTAEIIFDIIKSRRSFTYLNFSNYIININLIEEFMNLWVHIPDTKLEFVLPQANLTGSRRIGTRGVDKGAKEDLKQILKQQILRSNEDIDLLIIQFLQQEHLALIQNYFEK